jgi:hypothetical protein
VAGHPQSGITNLTVLSAAKRGWAERKRNITLSRLSTKTSRLRFMRILLRFFIIVNTGRDKIQRNPPPVKNLGIYPPDLII